MLDPGTVLGKRYEIIEEIGAGGMAIVYKAKDYKLRRMVALKVLKHEYSEDEAVLSKFRKEALAAGGLTHPNIVAVYDLGQDSYVDYIVMEYIDGITLKEYIRRRDKLSSDEVLKISIKIAEALKAAHANGIIHRDIKPQNIMVTPKGDVKVTDFGIAKAATSSTITNQGEALGSVHYFSPEQARGNLVDARSDLYSLGITMYEMVTNELPFFGETPVAVAMQQLHDPLPDPQLLAPDLWPGLRDVILKLGQKRPDARYQTAEELIYDLRQIYKNHSYRIAGEISRGGSLYEYGNRRPPVKTPEEQERDRQILIAQREERRRQQKRRRNVILVCAILGVLLLLGMVVALSQLLSGNGKPENSGELESSQLYESSTPDLESSSENSAVHFQIMPDVRGYTYEEASRLLNEQKIYFQVEQQYDDKVEIGHIINQEPSPSTPMEEGRKVVLYVSQGPEEVYARVPNLLEYSKEEAVRMLKEVGLDIGEVSFDYSNLYAEGCVIGQSIPKDSEVAKGTKVDITISRGREESSQAESNGGTITITQPFANMDDSGMLLVQAFDATGAMTIIYEQEVSYGTFSVLSGSLKVDYPAGTVLIEVYMDGGLLFSQNVG